MCPTTPTSAPSGKQAKNITVTVAARHFDVWPAVISRLVRGLRRDDDLARQYRTWLAAA